MKRPNIPKVTKASTISSVFNGDVEQTTVAYIIRDHDRARFESRKKKIERFGQ